MVPDGRAVVPRRLGPHPRPRKTTNCFDRRTPGALSRHRQARFLRLLCVVHCCTECLGGSARGALNTRFWSSHIYVYIIHTQPHAFPPGGGLFTLHDAVEVSIFTHLSPATFVAPPVAVADGSCWSFLGLDHVGRANVRVAIFVITR